MKHTRPGKRLVFPPYPYGRDLRHQRRARLSELEAHDAGPTLSASITSSNGQLLSPFKLQETSQLQEIEVGETAIHYQGLITPVMLSSHSSFEELVLFSGPSSPERRPSSPLSALNFTDVHEIQVGIVTESEKGSEDDVNGTSAQDTVTPGADGTGTRVPDIVVPTRLNWFEFSEFEGSRPFHRVSSYERQSFGSLISIEMQDVNETPVTAGYGGEEPHSYNTNNTPALPGAYPERLFVQLTGGSTVSATTGSGTKGRNLRRSHLGLFKILHVLFPFISLFVILCFLNLATRNVSNLAHFSSVIPRFPIGLSPDYLEEFQRLANQPLNISIPISQVRTVEALLVEVNSLLRESDTQPKPPIIDSLFDAPADIRESSEYLERIHIESIGIFERISATESAFSYYLGESGIRFSPLWVQRYLVGTPVEVAIMSTLDLSVVELSYSGFEMELVRSELGRIQGHLNVLDHALTIGDILASGLRGSVRGRIWLWWTGNDVSLDRVEMAHTLLRRVIAQLEEVQLGLSAGITALSARRDELYVLRNKLAHGPSSSSIAHLVLASGLGWFIPKYYKFTQDT